MAGERLDPTRDAINRTPDADTIGVGLGAVAGGAVAGAAAGTVAGPVGTAIGAAVGAVAGGLAGKAIADRAVNPSLEEAYWRQAYASEPYYEPDYGYDDYAPAYRVGFEVWTTTVEPRSFDEMERDLEAEYNNRRANSRLGWDKGRLAARAAYDHAGAARRH